MNIKKEKIRKMVLEELIDLIFERRMSELAPGDEATGDESLQGALAGFNPFETSGESTREPTKRREPSEFDTEPTRVAAVDRPRPVTATLAPERTAGAAKRFERRPGVEAARRTGPSGQQRAAGSETTRRLASSELGLSSTGTQTATSDQSPFGSLPTTTRGQSPEIRRTSRRTPGFRQDPDVDLFVPTGRSAQPRITSPTTEPRGQMGVSRADRAVLNAPQVGFEPRTRAYGRTEQGRREISALRRDPRIVDAAQEQGISARTLARRVHRGALPDPRTVSENRNFKSSSMLVDLTNKEVDRLLDKLFNK